MATKQTTPRSPLRVTVAPEVTARILERHATGEQVPQISRDLHLTPFEVSRMLRDATRTEPAQVTP